MSQLSGSVMLKWDRIMCVRSKVGKGGALLGASWVRD
jgi:hypothetical protein